MQRVIAHFSHNSLLATALECFQIVGISYIPCNNHFSCCSLTLYTSKKIIEFLRRGRALGSTLASSLRKKFYRGLLPSEI